MKNSFILVLIFLILLSCAEIESVNNLENTETISKEEIPEITESSSDPTEEKTQEECEPVPWEDLTIDQLKKANSFHVLYYPDLEIEVVNNEGLIESSNQQFTKLINSWIKDFNVNFIGVDKSYRGPYDGFTEHTYGFYNTCNPSLKSKNRDNFRHEIIKFSNSTDNKNFISDTSSISIFSTNNQVIYSLISEKSFSYSESKEIHSHNKS